MLPVPILLAVAVLVIIVGAVAVTRKREAARAEALLHFARTRGFEYRDKDPSITFQTHLFQRGHGKRLLNILSREDVGVHTLVFDYRFTENRGKHSDTDTQTVAAFRRDGRSLPLMEMRPENVMHKIANAFGWKDIDFENRPEFSSKYLLRGHDEGRIRRIMDSGTMAFFEKNLGWCVEADAAWVLVYRADKRVKPEDIAAFVDAARKIDDVLDVAVRGLRPNA